MSSRKREIRHFQVVVERRRQRNVQKSVMHVQNCFANTAYLKIFWCLHTIIHWWPFSYFFIVFHKNTSPETQGEKVEARECLNGREKNGAIKSKDREGQSSDWPERHKRFLASIRSQNWNWSGTTLSPGVILHGLYFSSRIFSACLDFPRSPRMIKKNSTTAVLSSIYYFVTIFFCSKNYCH